MDSALAHIAGLLTEYGEREKKEIELSALLTMAAWRGELDEISELISQGANINAGVPPALHCAVNEGHKEVVELLLTKGVDVDVRDNTGQTSLDIALSRDRKEIAELLQAKGASISSIYTAAQAGHLEGAKRLLEAGADVNKKDKDGLTPLLYAIKGGHKDLVMLLIAKGADNGLLWQTLRNHGSTIRTIKSSFFVFFLWTIL